MDSCLEHLDLSLHTSADADRRVWHFNVAFVGSCRVGKTKLLQRFVDSQFSDIYSETAETSFVSKSVSIGRHHVVFQCWDTPGSARSSGCIDSRLTQLHAIFIVIDASRDALADLEHWHHLASSAAGGGSGCPGPLLVFVANKTDLGCHAGSMTRARDLCLACGGLIFSLSVLTDEENLEVDAMMLEVGKALTERHAREVAAAAAASAAAAALASAATPAFAAAPAAATSAAAMPSPPQRRQAAAAVASAPQVAGDRLNLEREEPPPSPPPPLLSPPSASQSFAVQQDVAAATAKADRNRAGGDVGTDAASSKTVSSVGGDGGVGKSWWMRVCCCLCW